MNELRRWSEEGATAAELSLLELSRREHAPARARQRALEALGITAVLSTVAATTTSAAASHGGGFLLKLLGISALGGGLVVGGLAVHRTLRAPASPAHAAVSTPAVGLKAAAPRLIAGAEAPGVDLPAAVGSAPSSVLSSASASGVAPRLARTESASGGLSREVASLELAHRALAAHDPSSALHLLDNYRAEFPHGALGSEATVLRVQALLASGNRGAAQVLADSYSTRHPDSPYARRIQDILHSGR